MDSSRAWPSASRRSFDRSTKNTSLCSALDIVTMVILGGVSIAGGVGSILGVFLAVLVLGLLTFGMSLNNIPGQVVSVYIGALLIAVIAIPRIIERVRMRSVR